MAEREVAEAAGRQTRRVVPYVVLVAVLAALAGLLAFIAIGVIRPRWETLGIVAVAGAESSEELRVTVEHADCSHGPQVQVKRQTADLVELAARLDRRGDCKELVTTSVLTALLRAPVGSRRIVLDGPSGATCAIEPRPASRCGP